MGADLASKVARARRMEPCWNDLREQRVLGRITEARRRRAGTRRRTLVASVALAAAAAALFASRAAPPPEEPVRTADRAEPARLDLSDGSVALLGADARVRVDEHRRDAVRLTQQAGTVTYEVAHDPSRPFEVRAAHVTVRVRGTRFVVAMEPDFVEVRVADGRVEVEAHGRTSLLRRGEHMRVAAAPPPAERAEQAPQSPSAAAVEPAPAAPTTAADEPPRRRAPRSEPLPAPEPAPEAAPSLSEQLALADAARRAGRLDEATSILRAAVEAHDGEPGLDSALFTLGRLERRRGRHADAAEAFARSHAAAPEGPIAEDARAEEAVSLMEAGLVVRGRASARRYLQAHPEGLHASRVRALLP